MINDQGIELEIIIFSREGRDFSTSFQKEGRINTLTGNTKPSKAWIIAKFLDSRLEEEEFRLYSRRITDRKFSFFFSTRDNFINRSKIRQEEWKKKEKKKKKDRVARIERGFYAHRVDHTDSNFSNYL